MGGFRLFFIDMPPGTGDAYLTVAEIKPDHVLLVTSKVI